MTGFIGASVISQGSGWPLYPKVRRVLRLASRLPLELRPAGQHHGLERSFSGALGTGEEGSGGEPSRVQSGALRGGRQQSG